ncbi:hypothetical protein V491_07447 [Pseudogymnoascus sp. VKM F-3775]|nr:hypothetical protein V491_07447 [Pseudogymnoascus sp. VKM F-3775]
MNLRLLTLLVALSLAPAVVYAGNRAWESSIKYTNNSVLTNRVLPVRGNGTTAKGSRDDSHINNKRYLAIKPGKGDWDAETWPDAVIKYCFESDATKEKYFDDLIEARNLWYRANLPEEFGFEPMDDATCRDVAKRGQFLMIHDSQGLATTVGIPVSQAKSTTLKRGPTMNLTDSLEIGLLNRVANYAHEMGHAWGLHHEHQNPAYWGEPYSEGGGTIFGEGNWNCEKLKDYEGMAQRIRNEEEAEHFANLRIREACTSRVDAGAEGFSAYNYLPIVSDPILANQKEIDWDSIMIYPSGAGGTPSDGSGTDNRSPILLKPDGSRIPINLKPSIEDVKGLRKLYGVKKVPKWQPLGAKGASTEQKFNRVFGRC